MLAQTCAPAIDPPISAAYMDHWNGWDGVTGCRTDWNCTSKNWLDPELLAPKTL